MTTRKRLGAAAVAALLLASEATAFAPPPSATIAVASPSRFVRGGCALRGDSTSSPPPSPALAGRDGRSSRSTYAPYSIGDGRVGVGGEVGRPPPAAGVGGGGTAGWASSSTPLARLPGIVHVDRATPEPVPAVAAIPRLVATSPPRQYGIGSWRAESSSSLSSSSSSSAASGLGRTILRRPIVAGNWKLNPPTRSEAITLLRLLAANFVNHRSSNDGPEAVIFPPLPYLSDAVRILEGTGILVGAQNAGRHDGGAYTGEIAPSMLLSSGCSYVLLGHSERRSHFGETDGGINAALRGCMDQPGLKVMLCVGETLEEYENGRMGQVVDAQVRGCLAGVDASAVLRDDRVVIAYEPVWAIGTGLVATPVQVNIYFLFAMIFSGLFISAG